MKPLAVSVLSRPPHSGRDGLAIRNFHLLAALAAAFRVRAITLFDPERLYEGEWPAGVDVEVVPQTPRAVRRIAAAVASVAAGGAYSQRLYRSAELERRLRRLAGDERPAWIVAHAYHVAPAALASGAPVWIDFHNLDSEIWRRTGETAGAWLVRRFALLQARRVAALEKDLATRAAGVSCVSARDAAALGGLGARTPLVVPNGVDLGRHAWRRARAPGEVVLFVGDLSWPPNADGVRWFLREVWPRVRSLRPSARAEILGRSAPPDLARLGGRDVELLGEGGDARAHWARAAVAVVPLRAGGGTRLKILEAAASGVPVVSTSVGAEGLDLVSDSEILRRDEAGAFAGAVAGLLGDPAAASRLAAAARARVEASYGWGPIGRRFAEELARRAGAAA